MAPIFRKYRELWSVRQTFKWFHDHELELPVNKFVAGWPQLVWQLPTQSFLSNVLRNAFYAGAYIYCFLVADELTYDCRRLGRAARTNFIREHGALALGERRARVWRVRVGKKRAMTGGKP